MKIFIVSVVYAAIVYVVSYFTAKWMVKKRILFARMFKIVTEQPDKITDMKKMGREILFEINMPPYKYHEGTWEGYLVSVSNEKSHSVVKVENDSIEVWVSDDGREKVTYKFFTERLATEVAMTMMLLLFSIISLVGIAFLQ